MHRFRSETARLYKVLARPAVKRGADAGAAFQSAMLTLSDEDKKRLFNLRDKDFAPRGA